MALIFQKKKCFLRKNIGAGDSLNNLVPYFTSENMGRKHKLCYMDKALLFVETLNQNIVGYLTSLQIPFIRDFSQLGANRHPHLATSHKKIR